MCGDADTIMAIARAHEAEGWKVNGAGGEGGLLTILLPNDGRTSWVRERLLKDKRDIDVLAAIALEPSCDLGAVASASAAWGERGIVRGAVPGFPVYGQPRVLAGCSGALRDRTAHPRHVR